MSFLPACTVDEVATDTALAVEIDGTDLAIVNSGGTFYAIADECSHAAIPLSGGRRGGESDATPWSGSPEEREDAGLPATEPVAVIP